MITIQNLTKKYKNFTALDNVSFDLPDTGLIALTGENGCGKTTLLNIIGTVDAPTDGSVAYNDCILTGKNLKKYRKETVTYVQQDNKFIEYLDILQNIGITGASDSDIGKLLEKYGIPEKKTSLPCNLSGGQKQKCSFIRGIIRNTPVLLVDEPTSSMDTESEESTFKLLKDLSRDRLVILVSHNRVLINTYADLIIRMNNGKIISSFDNRNKLQAQFTEQTILFPDSDRYSPAEDWVRVKAVLRENDNVSVGLYHPETTCSDAAGTFEKIKLSFSTCIHKTADIINTTYKSLKNQLVRISIPAFFTAILVVLCSMVISIKSVNTDRLAYDVLTGNGYNNITYMYQYPLSDNSPLEELTHNDLWNNTDACVKRRTLYINLNQGKIDIGISKDSTYYYKKILNLAIIDCSHPEEYELAAGVLPSAGSAMITDYIADQLIEFGDYVSYSDIIEKGVFIGGINEKISGVLKTDYKDYTSLYTYGNGVTDIQYDRALYMGEYFYCCLFQDKEQYMNFPDFGLKMICFNEGLCFADIVVMDDDSKQGVFINTALAEITEEQNSVKCFFFNYGKSQKNIIADNNERPIVYVSRSFYETRIDFINQVSVFKTVPYICSSFEINNLDEFLIVKNNFQNYQTPLKDVANRLETEVTIIKDDMLVLLFIILSLTTLFAFWMWIEADKKQRFTVYSMIVNGYDSKHVWMFKGLRLAANYVIQFAFATVLYYISINAVNSILTKIIGCKVVLFTNSFAPVIIAFALFIICCSTAVALHTRHQLKDQPINHYRTSA